jgi:hypothetical protein
MTLRITTLDAEHHTECCGIASQARLHLLECSVQLGYISGEAKLVQKLVWRHDSWHDDTQHNDIQHDNIRARLST